MREQASAWLLACTLTCGTAGAALHGNADAALDERVNRLTSELRCVVCQNQTVADSHVPLAIQLRQEVRAQLAAGVSEAAVRDFMVQRYGDFVLYRPPWRAATAALWLGPILLLLLGLGGLAWHLRHHDPQDGDSA